MNRDIVIVGGGAAGILTAIHLLRRTSAPISVTVVEPREHLAEGVAYSTSDTEHLLNVPAAGMSAYGDEPRHFALLAQAADSDFVARHHYSEYLRNELQQLSNDHPESSVRHVRDSARTISTAPLGVATTGDSSIRADVVVLALGNAAPTKPEWWSRIRSTKLIDDPWTPGALDAVDDRDNVLCVGTGLTFVDVALTLSRRGCRVTGVSRHGLLPRVHAPQSTLPPVPAEFDSPAAVSRWIRTQPDWQTALTALRPRTQDVWHSFSSEQQASFLRHGRRYWDVHRHRMSVEVADKLHAARHSGLVEVVRGDAERLATQSTFDAIILCTGPDDAALLSTNPLQGLGNEGHVCIGPHGIGIDTDPTTGQVRNRVGMAVQNMYAIGPLRRGTLWESTAIPEIRSEAEALALRVLA